jgi:superfamily II DNA or RNA helicase
LATLNAQGGGSIIPSRTPREDADANKGHLVTTSDPITLTFRAGTLEVRGLPEASGLLGALASWDGRSACHRAPALAYPDIVTLLHRQKIPHEDKARAYEEIPAELQAQREPRPYQEAALAAWLAHRGRGVIVLPTGSGKTHLALMAMARKKRSTLVVAPTLDLVRQWFDLLGDAFGVPIGLVGGGEHTVLPITVTTYDSAYLHMEHFGNKFGMVVFDECHHLPSGAYAMSAQFCIAPFRLGLTATPERTDGGEQRLVELIGPTAFRRDINELSGEYLASYETVRLVADLTPEERTEYDAARAIYKEFVRTEGIRFTEPGGWNKFIMMSARSKEGMAAMAAYRRQKELMLAGPAKMKLVEDLLQKHHRERVLLFTQDNATVYAMSRQFLVPSITHQTKVRERSEILRAFREGTYGAIATSKVLNEGVDVPEASVAIVVSGSGSIREHVQRLGRILRKQEGKRAVLYELISANTTETFTSERRRDHSAYR